MQCPFVIPNVLNVTISSAGWADVATIAPWNMYLAYGDKRILENQYNSMKNYVERIRRSARIIYGIPAFILATGFSIARMMITTDGPPLPINTLLHNAFMPIQHSC